MPAITTSLAARAALACAPIAVLLALGPASAGAAVWAYPSPGIDVASPRTQLSFRGVAPAGLAGLRVTGSRSGRHDGAIRAHSDGAGASFVPARPFRAGERVTVTAPVDVAGAGEAYSFGIARLAPNVPLNRRQGRTAAAGTTRLVTRPDLRPPAWDVHARRAGASGAEIITGPKLFATRNGQEGVQVLTGDGRVRYWRPLPSGEKATDARVQSFRGNPALTFWQGLTLGGQGRGEGVILGSQLQVLARVRMGNGYAMDLHEFRLTPQGTALVMAYQAVSRDLRAYGGRRRGAIIDGVIQELDIPTGLVVFEWHSAGAVGLDESDGRPRGRVAWDYFHPNSVFPDGDGVIVSARHTNGVYRILRSTGQIDWRLGGTDSDFRPGPGAAFARQHDAQVQADATLRIFDNSARRGRRRSRVIVLRLDRAARTATLVSSADRGGHQFAGTQGNAEILPGGTTFANWGSRGGVSEIAPGNRLLFDAFLPRGWDNYRAYRADWVAQPRSRPEVAARAAGARATRVYASWNGATEVASWRVLAGSSRDALAPVAATLWRDLETAVTVPAAGRWFAVQALDAAGRVLAVSHAVQRRS